MIRLVLKQIGFSVTLAAIFGLATSAKADFLGSSIGGEAASALNAAHENEALSNLDLQSWVPYQAEFPEVRALLNSTMNPRVTFIERRGQRYFDSQSSIGAESSSSAPSSDGIDLLRKCLDQFAPAAERTGTGTSPRPVVERNSQVQTCLLVAEEHWHIQIGSRVIASSKAAPASPFHPDIFHPLRRLD